MKSNLSPENLFEEPIIFCNFFKKGAERKDMVYEEAKDINKVTKVINEYMQDETNLNLVLFSDAIFHLCRIARCFIFEKGHIVLIGLSGSGKKSLITLGGTLAQARVVTI
jgi:dynein heavy chain